MDVLRYEGNVPYAIRDSTSRVDTSLFASGPVNPTRPLTTHRAQPTSYVSSHSRVQPVHHEKRQSLHVSRIICWGFPKIDHSGIDARIVLEQNKIQEKSYL